MASPVVVSDAFLLWSQWLLLWTSAAYGITADPLHGETARFRWHRWTIFLASRVILAVALAYGLSRSLSVSALLLLITLAQPLLRYRLPMRWLAEFEGFWIFAFASPRPLDHGVHYSVSAGSYLHPGKRAIACGSWRNLCRSWSAQKIRNVAISRSRWLR